MVGALIYLLLIALPVGFAWGAIAASSFGMGRGRRAAVRNPEHGL